MDIEQEIVKLKSEVAKLNQAYIQSRKNQVPITGRTDTAYAKCPQVDTNTANIQVNADDIITTQEGLAQTYEDTQTNADDILATQEGLAQTYEETYTSITNLEEALAEVYEMILPTE